MVWVGGSGAEDSEACREWWSRSNAAITVRKCVDRRDEAGRMRCAGEPKDGIEVEVRMRDKNGWCDGMPERGWQTGVRTVSKVRTKF